MEPTGRYASVNRLLVRVAQAKSLLTKAEVYGLSTRADFTLPAKLTKVWYAVWGDPHEPFPPFHSYPTDYAPGDVVCSDHNDRNIRSMISTMGRTLAWLMQTDSRLGRAFPSYRQLYPSRLVTPGYKFVPVSHRPHTMEDTTMQFYEYITASHRYGASPIGYLTSDDELWLSVMMCTFPNEMWRLCDQGVHMLAVQALFVHPDIPRLIEEQGLYKPPDGPDPAKYQAAIIEHKAHWADLFDRSIADAPRRFAEARLSIDEHHPLYRKDCSAVADELEKCWAPAQDTVDFGEDGREAIHERVDTLGRSVARLVAALRAVAACIPTRPDPFPERDALADLPTLGAVRQLILEIWPGACSDAIIPTTPDTEPPPVPEETGPFRVRELINQSVLGSHRPTQFTPCIGRGVYVQDTRAQAERAQDTRAQAHAARAKATRRQAQAARAQSQAYRAPPQLYAQPQAPPHARSQPRPHAPQPQYDECEPRPSEYADHDPQYNPQYADRDPQYEPPLYADRDPQFEPPLYADRDPQYDPRYASYEPQYASYKPPSHASYVPPSHASYEPPQHGTWPNRAEPPAPEYKPTAPEYKPQNSSLAFKRPAANPALVFKRAVDSIKRPDAPR